MALKGYKPTTPGRRGMTGFAFEELSKITARDLVKDKDKKLTAQEFKKLKKKARRLRKKEMNSLTEALPRVSARSSDGRVSMRGRGGRAKRRYRLVDFRRDKVSVPATVKYIEYDPNRTTRVAMICYKDGEKSYILAPNGLKEGDIVISSNSAAEADIKVGNCLPLSEIPVGTEIHNIELRPGKGGQMVRGAGTVATLAAKDKKYCQVRLPSSEVRLILSTCRASIGQLGNIENENLKWGKAGRRRYKGHRPQVRGQAMNPIDHPLGGGEGVGKGHHPVTPWGQPCKGFKTRKSKRTDVFIVRRRKKKGK